MQPKTTLQFDTGSFNQLREKIKITKTCNRERDRDPAFALQVPFEVGLKLSNRCDLRCTHCFQWNEEGYHKKLTKEELGKSGDMDINTIRKVLESTREKKSSLYLWGGEPLVYDKWDELVELLSNDVRATVLCTNGIQIKSKLDSIVKISEKLTMLISIEGMEEDHNKLRGAKSFSRTMEGLEALLDLQKKGIYKGKISIAGVISNELVGKLYEFCEYFETKGINTLYINLPWHITDELAAEMDRYFAENFSWIERKRKTSTWDGFKFKIDPELITQLNEQMNRIYARKWNIRIRFQPYLNPDEMPDFIAGKPVVPEQRTRCLGISNRLDIMPSGNVTPCKKFSEFVVGNVNEQTDILEVWHGEKFTKFRNILNNGLHPICSKCEILYSNGL